MEGSSSVKNSVEIDDNDVDVGLRRSKYKDSDMKGSSSVKNSVEIDDNDVDVGLRRSKRIKERVRKRRAVVRKKKPSTTDKVAHVLAHILIPVTAFQGLAFK